MKLKNVSKKIDLKYKVSLVTVHLGTMAGWTGVEKSEVASAVTFPGMGVSRP